MHKRPGTQEALFEDARRRRDDVVEGEVLGVTYENPESGFRIVRAQIDGRRDPMVLVGVFPACPPGSRVRATGRFEEHKKHGPQFKVETLLSIMPETLEGLTRFLGSGMIKGIGPTYAARIVEAFGLQTLEVLDQRPDRLSEVPGLGQRRIESVKKAWVEHRAIGAIMIFLQSHGASPALATRVYRRFGARAIEIVSRAPYRLALDVWGIGFKTADRIAQSIGIRPDAPERAQAGVLQVLHDLSSRGHVFAEIDDLAAAGATMLEVEEGLVREAIAALAAAGRVVTESVERGTAVFLKDLHDAETRVAKRLAVLARAVGDTKSAALVLEGAPRAMAAFEQRQKIELAPAQRGAIQLAARHKVVVVTGGPGVGKTTIVRAVLSVFDQARLHIRLAAPTGRAAKRMTETTGREAVTLHRLLEFDPRARTFSRNVDRQLEVDVLIVDEASMIDLPMADALLAALPEHVRLVWVGDVDQLPSVGPGAVLRDLIESGALPVARLDQIFRQAAGSLIVENAHRIHTGQAPIGAEGSVGEFFVFERKDPEAAADSIVELVTRRIPRSFGLSPARDVQVLTPMHAGPAGAIALNERLQAALNPEGASVARGARTLRVGDKVMQLRNDYDRDVFNGDIGIISDVDAEEQQLVVSFDGRKVVYEDSDLDELTLAYATSIHKSQGSEYPAVVIPLLTAHFVMLSRNLLYTAVTRGKRLVILVADPRAIRLALAETRKEDRNTELATRLTAALGRR